MENSGEELSGPAVSFSASFLGANVFIYGKKNSKLTRDSCVCQKLLLLLVFGSMMCMRHLLTAGIHVDV